MFKRIILAAAAAASMAFAPAHGADAQEQTIRLGVSGLSGGKLPLFVAEDEGYFKKHGIKAEILEFKSGGAVVQAFVGGSIDFCICNGDHIVNLTNKGLPVAIVSGLDEHNATTLVARAVSPYTDIRSLKGQKLAITSPGSATDNVLRTALRKAGLDPQKDAQIVSTGTGTAMLTAIRTDRVAAGVLTTNQIIKANLSADKLKVIDEWRDTPYPSLVAIGRKKWIEQNPETARGFARALAEAARTIQADPAAAERGIALIFPGESPAFIKELTEATQRTLSKDGSVSEEGFKNVLEVMLQISPDLKPVDFASINAQAQLVK